MPTIIDSLIVKLGLDSKDLENKVPGVTKALKDIETESDKTEKGVKKVGDTSKDTGRSFGELTRAAGSFLALIGGTVAIKGMISDFIESNAALERLSLNLGLGVSTISAWSQANEQLGGSAAGLQGTLDMLSRSQTQLMLTGESSLIPYLSALGISLAGVDGKARPVTDILLSLADRFSAMDRPTANNMGRMMGIDQGTMNLLLQGRRELELTINRQKEHSAVTKAQAEEAQKLQTKIVGVRQSFEAFGRGLIEKATPALEALLDKLTTFGSWLQANQEVIGDFLKVLAVGLGAIAIAAIPLDPLIIAIIGVAGAIALLWQDYQVWKRGGDSLIDWSSWKVGIDAALHGIEAIEAAIHSLGSAYDNFVQKITGKSLSEIGGGKSSWKTALWGGKTGDVRDLGSNGISEQAKAQASRVSKMTGIPADILWSQWAHETGGFSNRGASQLNNLAGVNTPGGKGQDYRKFSSLDEFGDYYAKLMRPDGRYAGAANAKSPEEFAAILKAGGYYSDSQSNYASGMRQWDNKYAQSLSGIPGASQVASQAPSGAANNSTSSTDRSVTNSVGEIKIYTQATDAPGIAKDLGQSMDYLFTSQANSGVW